MSDLGDTDDMKSGSKFRRLDDRLPQYGEEVATVIRRILFEEQRKLGLKNPRDIVTIIERIIDEAVAEPAETESVETDQ